MEVIIARVYNNFNLILQIIGLYLFALSVGFIFFFPPIAIPFLMWIGIGFYFWLIVYQAYKNTNDNQELYTIEQVAPEPILLT